jgi:hypothetical protein
MSLERRLRPMVLAGASGVLVALLAASAAGAKPEKLPKGKPIDPTEPCTLVSRGQANVVFAAPTDRDKGNDASPVTTDCALIIGPSAAPTGRLVMSVVFPVFGGSETDAVNVVESDRANAQLSGPGVADLPLGKGGFLQKPRSLVEVAPSKKFAFTLQWFPTGGPPEGGPVTEAVRKQLTVLATDIAKRGKQIRTAAG